MSHDYLINIATGLYIVCYVPELYANYKNKNANIYNLPEKVLILAGTIFSLSYAILNENQALISNYSPIFALDLIAFLMRSYYVLHNCAKKNPITTSVTVQTDFLPITVTVVSLD
jgi:hypothetical protein